METVKVSIIIPVYNTECYLPQCIESLLHQTYTDFEIICVDDGSTDHSVEIIHRYMSQDDRIKLICQQHQFLGAARNNGFRSAQGEYVLFLDSDDYFDKALLDSTIEMADETDADIVVFGGFDLWPDGTVTRNNSLLDEKIVAPYRVFSRRDIPDDILTFSSPAVWNKLYRRSFLESNDLIFSNIQFAEDVPFTKPAFAFAEKIACVNKPLIFYRRLREGSNENIKLGASQVFLTALKLLYQILLDRGLFRELERSFCNYAISLLNYELKPYEDRPDRFRVYKEVFSSDVVRDSGLLDHENAYYLRQNRFHYVKGLQSAFSFHNRYKSVRSETLKLFTDALAQKDPSCILSLQEALPNVVQGSVTPEDIYRCFITWIGLHELSSDFSDSAPESVEHQAAINKVMKTLLSEMRQRYSVLPESLKTFYLGMEDKERFLFESIAVDYVKKEKELILQEQKMRKSRELARSLQSDIKKRDDDIACLTKSLKQTETKERKARAKLEKVLGSRSFRIGRILTWPFRKLRSLRHR